MSGVWPTAAVERVLMACVGREAEARQALHLVPEILPGEDMDAATASLAPLVYRRWPKAEHSLVAAGRKAYLTYWRQNQERVRELQLVLAAFRELEIPCIVLKGVALALRYYRDLGVRRMCDFDLLVDGRDLETAVRRLEKAGYAAERGLSAEAILRRVRVGHAWQFSSRAGQSCDLHWRPLVRCSSPLVTRWLWEASETIPIGDSTTRVLAPTDQLFHVCAHGLQWDWQPPIRWIADAMTVLREPIDWARLCRLAVEARMSIRLAEALGYLRFHFAPGIPAEVLDQLEGSAPEWERREYRLLLKPCPLGFVDSFRWHQYHFRRLRAHDPVWNGMPVWSGFPRYLGAFLNARNPFEFWTHLRPQLTARVRAHRAGL